MTSPPGPGAHGTAQPFTPAPDRRPGGRTALTVIAVVLLVAGVGLLGWVAFQYFGTNVISKQAFEQEKAQLRDAWQREGSVSARGEKPATAEEEKKLPGEAIALLRVPAFGSDYEVPILEGVDLADLNRGVGHYSTSVMPGQIGNFAIAGHRITHGEPFAKLLELNTGDQVIVETRDATYTYVMDEPPRDLTVADTATWVLEPVPGKPTEKPTTALLTMTTCQDLFRSPDRSVGFGHLVATKTKG